MTKAIVEDGIVINIIEHTTGELTLPEGQQLIDPEGQLVGIGFSYNAETGLFTDAHPPVDEAGYMDISDAAEDKQTGFLGRVASGLRGLLKL